MNERFKVLLEYLITNKEVRNQQEFAEIISSDKSTVSQIKNGKANIPNIMFERIASSFLSINIDWLRTGNGDMLKSLNQATVIAGNDNRANTETYRFISLLEKKDEQIDRLLTLLEKQTKN